MQTSDIAVCTINVFGDDVRQFWMDNLGGLLASYPELEMPHKQDFYMLLIVDSATGEIVIDNDKIRFDRDEIFIIKPRCVTSIDINRQAKGKIICFTEDFFSLRYNNNTLNQFSFLQQNSRPYMRLNAIQKEKITSISKLFCQEFQQNMKETAKVLRSYLNILLFDIERLYRPFGLLKNTNVKQEKIHQFENLIDQHYETKKLPSSYADLLNVSANYLNKICKDETGLTAGEMIRKRIIIEAKRLLHYTPFSVCEIADKLGFENISYFVTFFKKSTGYTPEQFRQIQQ